VLRQGHNIHEATAASLLRKPIAKVTSEEKQIGKTTNFALLYGAGPNRLRTQLASDGVRISEPEAYDIFRKFLETYPAFNRRRKEMSWGFEDGTHQGGAHPHRPPAQ
jgi:DNA polymerase I-like protein with 3'-5' exonuclease and polymerase domains